MNRIRLIVSFGLYPDVTVWPIDDHHVDAYVNAYLSMGAIGIIRTDFR